jgi:hypothetical protein
MAKHSISFPTSIDLHSALEFSVVLHSAADVDLIEIDFENTMRVEPFGMLLISSEIDLMKKRYPKTVVAYKNYEHMSYAAQMGFFYVLGIEHSVPMVQADAQSIPITVLDCATIIRNAALKGIETGDEVEEQSRAMAEMLCQGDQGDIFDTLSYAIREIMRNVVEHSNASKFGICAQYWKAQNKVEVGILDRGIGLRKSLSPNPHLDVSDDYRAINYALMPAVSGKAFKGTRVKQSGPWSNSGFGLYMTNRICRNGGNFFVATGETGMLLTKGEGKRYFDCHFQGTAIRLIIKLGQLEDLRTSLDRYRLEGFEIQRRYKEIVKIDPSSASLMLSEDFDLSTWDKLLNSVRKN